MRLFGGDVQVFGVGAGEDDDAGGSGGGITGGDGVDRGLDGGKGVCAAPVDAFAGGVYEKVIFGDVAAAGHEGQGEAGEK